MTVEFSSPLESLGVKVRLSKIENRNLKSEIWDQTLSPLPFQNWCFVVVVVFFFWLIFLCLFFCAHAHDITE